MGRCLLFFSYWFSHGVKPTVYATYGANDEAYVKGARQPVQHQADPELQPCHLKNKQSWQTCSCVVAGHMVSDYSIINVCCTCSVLVPYEHY